MLRKTYKRLLAVLCCAALCVSIVPAGAAAEALSDSNNSQLTEEELRNKYFASTEFLAHYNADPADALEMLDKIVENYFFSTVSNARSSGAQIISVAVTPVKQLTTTSCGPASAYMAISGWDGTDSISGDTTTDKLQTLATEMGTNSSGTMVYKMRDYINKYLPDGKNPYIYTEGSTLTEADFRNYCYCSLAYTRIPILHARTEYLSYYNGHETGHYIPVIEIDYTTKTVTLQDSNRSSAYYGTHEVPWEEAYSSIHDYTESERFLIHYWP